MDDAVAARRATYSVRDLRERYGGISEATVLTWIHSGQLRAINVGRTPGGRKNEKKRGPESEFRPE